jgi:hypothetical protein
MDIGASFAGLLQDRDALARVTLAIEKAVDDSFAHHGLIIVPGSRTAAETKRRVGVCLDIFKVLRGDMKWSWQRAADHIPIYLRKVLDGEPWEPSARAAWTANAT